MLVKTKRFPQQTLYAIALDGTTDFAGRSDPQAWRTIARELIKGQQVFGNDLATFSLDANEVGTLADALGFGKQKTERRRRSER